MCEVNNPYLASVFDHGPSLTKGRLRTPQSKRIAGDDENEALINHDIQKTDRLTAFIF